MSIFKGLDDKGWLQLLVFFAISFFYASIVSCWTSFLTPFYKADACVFSVMANGWMHGMIPYQDLFDHKGPFVYLFYSAQSLDSGGRFFLTLLQALFMTINACFIYRLSRLFTSPAGAWLTVAASGLFIAACADSSLATEELSLPFSLMPLYILMAHGVQRGWRMEGFPCYGSALFGACVGIIFMIRANNAITVCCCIFVLLLLLYRSRCFSLLFRHALTVLAGFLAAVAPFVLYFSLNGAWDDFLFGNLIFNMRYAGSSSVDNLLLQTGRCIFLLPLLCVGVVNLKTKTVPPLSYCIVLFIAVCSFLVSSMGLGYRHYTITALPAFALAFCLMLKMARHARLTSSPGLLICCCFMAAVSVSPFCRLALRHVKLGRDAVLYADNPSSKAHGEYLARTAILNLGRHIPEAERQSVFALNGFGEVYMYLGIIPRCKYFMLHDMFEGVTGGLVGEEVLPYFERERPLWVYAHEKPKLLTRLIESQYTEIAHEGSYTLFRLRTQPPSAAPAETRLDSGH